MVSFSYGFAVAAAALVSARSTTASSSSDDESNLIVLEDFSASQHEWEQMNDPVMGGKSTGSFHVTNGLGVFVGKVAIVPFLHAPGFIKVETTAGESWPDVSSCEGLQLTIKSTTDYDGYRVSFGKNRPPDAFPYTYGYKTDMKIDGDANEFSTVQLPFDDFTDKWDAATGDAIVTCKEDNQYCPDEATKNYLFSIAIWGEGKEGDVHLEIQMIAAYGCGSSTTSELPLLPSHHDPFAPETEKSGGEITIEDFSNPLNSWAALNDPVMGGQSKSSVTIEDGIAHFTGRCAIVPFLHAPGFITMVTGGYMQEDAIFPDISTCNAFKVILRTTVDYKGYYMSFGTVHVPGGRYASGYKTHLEHVPKDEFAEMILPFDTFSSKWDDATGHIEVKCSEDKQYCPDMETLLNMKTMSFWGEGVEGDVALDIQWIGAIGCSDTGRDVPLLGSPAMIQTMVLQNEKTKMAQGQNSMMSLIAGTLFIILGVVFALEYTIGGISRNHKKSSYEELKLDAVAASPSDLA